jgi:hypothetical protein
MLDSSWELDNGVWSSLINSYKVITFKDGKGRLADFRDPHTNPFTILGCNTLAFSSSLYGTSTHSMPFSFLHYVNTEAPRWLKVVYLYRDHKHARWNVSSYSFYLLKARSPCLRKARSLLFLFRTLQSLCSIRVISCLCSTFEVGDKTALEEKN